MPSFRRTGAAILASAALLLSVPLGVPAAAQTGSTAPAAAADAYGLDVDVTLPLGIDVDEGPFARVTQEYPPLAPEAAEDSLVGAGPIPASGSAVVQKVGVLSTSARAGSEPKAVASAQATEVKLLEQGGVPMITADLLRAVSTTDCTSKPSAAGTKITNLVVAGVEAPINDPGPNYVLAAPIFDPLGIRVILNEQNQAADGRGLVVNAIHIFALSDSLVPPLFSGDIVVSHAMSTVNCPNGAPSEGTGNPIFITKDASKPVVRRGDTLAYTATFRNTHELGCLVNTAIDHLPVAFELVSTSGAFGTEADTVARPGGGTDVVLKPENVTIPSGGSVTQTFVVKVKDDAAPATYFNNVELFCANLGNWVKGLDAPVTVVTDTPRPEAPPQCSDKKDNDGDGKIDFPNDPGCASPQDDDESDIMPRTGVPAVAGALAALLVGGGLLLRRVLNARP